MTKLTGLRSQKQALDEQIKKRLAMILVWVVSSLFHMQPHNIV